ncbi:hypothetical protein GOP47_0022101, partial [Adiantum capillus-veneris]
MVLQVNGMISQTLLDDKSVQSIESPQSRDAPRRRKKGMQAMKGRDDDDYYDDDGFLDKRERSAAIVFDCPNL